MQLFVGDIAAREVADHQPAKFAAMECIQETGPDQTEYVGGICTDDGVKGAIGIPGLDSFLVGFSTDTEVTGLERHPARRAAARQHPAPPLLRRDGRDRHGAAGARRSGSPSPGGGVATFPQTPWFLRAVAASGAAAIVALWCRLDRHRGRPPALDRAGLHAHRAKR